MLPDMCGPETHNRSYVTLYKSSVAKTCGFHHDVNPTHRFIPTVILQANAIIQQEVIFQELIYNFHSNSTHRPQIEDSKLFETVTVITYSSWQRIQ